MKKNKFPLDIPNGYTIYDRNLANIINHIVNKFTSMLVCGEVDTNEKYDKIIHRLMDTIPKKYGTFDTFYKEYIVPFLDDGLDYFDGYKILKSTLRYE